MRTVSHNTAFLTGASIVQKALSFVYFTILARSFTSSELGTYSYALAFTTLFAVLVDGGLSPVLIRHVAGHPSGAIQILRRVLRIKVILLAVTVVLMAGVVLMLVAARAVAPLIMAATLVMTIDSLHLTVYGVIRGRQNLLFESVGMVFSQCLSLVGVVMVAFFQLPIFYAIVALGVGSGANALWALYALRRTAGAASAVDAPASDTPIQRNLSVRSLAAEATPFALAGVFARGYSYLDVLLIGSLMSFAAAGTYSIANKLTFVFQFIPLALSASLYPAFSKLGLVRASESATLWESSERYLLIMLGFIVAMVVALRSPLLLFFGAEHISAGSALGILAVSLVFSFASYPIGALLNGMGLQRLQTTAMGCALVANAALNAVLIPYFGVNGAATSALVGNATLALIGGYFAQRRVASLPWVHLGTFALRCTLSGAAAGAAIAGTHASIGTLLIGESALAQLTRIGVAAGVGFLAYVGVGLTCGCFTLADLRRPIAWIRAKMRAVL